MADKANRTRHTPPFHAAHFIFLDRDGVINRKPPEGVYITQPAQLELLPGAAHAIAQLNRAGRTVIVVTNQRGIALNLMSTADLDRVHAELRSQLALAGAHLDALYTCPHDRNQCTCRKPATGLLDQAFHDFPAATPETSLLIGDSLSDIECGRRAYIPTILIEGDPTRRKPGFETAQSLATAVTPSLAAAIPLILPN